MKCNLCSNKNIIKKGKRKTTQQFYCKCCRKYFLESYRITRMNPANEKHLIGLHCEGMGTRSIAREMGISHTCVMKTKLKIAATLAEPEAEPGQVYQMDELATFVAWKKKPKRRKGKKNIRLCRQKNEIPECYIHRFFNKSCCRYYFCVAPSIDNNDRPNHTPFADTGRRTKKSPKHVFGRSKRIPFLPIFFGRIFIGP